MEERHYENIELKANGNGAQAIVLSEDGMCLAAFWSRLLCGCGTEGTFEPVFVMENIIPLFDTSFNYEIVEKSSWNYSEFLQAYYSPEQNKIVIRSDVYEGALSGNAMDIITVAHEVVHCIESIIMRFLNALKCVDFKTEFCKENSKEMLHHEFQTDRITNLVLRPEILTIGKSDEEIIQKYFVAPLVQFTLGVVKMAGEALKESLNVASHSELFSESA